jgi:hypothetical protein
MSYSEFKEPLDSRLTAEDWRQILARDQAPPRPNRVSSLSAE